MDGNSQPILAVCLPVALAVHFAQDRAMRTCRPLALGAKPVRSMAAFVVALPVIGFSPTTGSMSVMAMLRQPLHMGVDSSPGEIVGSSIVQILVVDDFAPWRRFVGSMLQNWTGLRLVGEASDGLEAVQKAEELQPDLILMDLGLPKLNGIEAARRIQKLSIKSKIVFVSTQRDLDIIQEAFRSGISGYVLKSAALTQLPPALEAVLQGQRFLCPCLITGTKDSRIIMQP